MADPPADLVARLRAAGCVFAEEEAAILVERAAGDDALLDRLASARAGGAPLEPLVGWVGFAGARLAVGPGVFVPRQRTLRLLDRVLSALRGGADRSAADGDAAAREPVFVEAFAGVAPLASAVASAMPHARVFACERDPLALRYARENLGSRGSACESDVLTGLPRALLGRVDVIGAVPPYVPDGEIELLPREAREHEPLAALSGGSDGLRWVRALVDEAIEWMAPDGAVLLELSERQVDAAIRYGESRGWTAGIVDAPEESSTRVLALSQRASSAASSGPTRRTPGEGGLGRR